MSAIIHDGNNPIQWNAMSVTHVGKRRKDTVLGEVPEGLGELQG